MSKWIKIKNNYYYVNIDDESDVIRKEYLSKVYLYNNFIAFDFVQQPKKVFNTDVAIEEIMNQLSIDDEVKDIVKRDFKMIPINHLQFLIDNNIKILKSKHDTYYSSVSKTINIDVSQLGEGMIAHEMGHMFVDINSLYKNNELKIIMKNVLHNIKKITSKFINNDSYIYVESDKFIREYQGRTYILEKDYYSSNMQLAYYNLEEYLSVGFETFVINPKLLYTKDKDLYNFVVKGGLLNENV